MPVPVLFMFLPLALAPVIYFLQARRNIALGLATATPLLLLILILGLPLDQPLALFGGVQLESTFTLLGRVFAIDAVNRLALAFVFSQATVLCAATYLAPSGRFYLPAGTAVLGLLAAALFVRPFLFAALFLQMATALSVFMLADEGHPTLRGAFRHLVFATMGMPFILVTGWVLENTGNASDFIPRATVLLGIGFAVLMAVAPFHSWVPEVAENSAPLAAAFVFTVHRYVIVFLYLNFLNTYDWLRLNEDFAYALTLAGGGMALLGALLVFSQRNFGRSMGYAMLIDIGALLLALGLNTAAGVEAALSTLAMRGLALPLWAVGLAHLRQASGSDDFDAVQGVARQYPMASVAVVTGLLSLVGFPLTAGFPARWALLSLLAEIHPTGAIFLLVGMVSVAFVCARGLARLLQPRPEQAVGFLEQRLAVGAYSVGFTVILSLGLAPQWLLPTIARAAAVFVNLAR